MSSCNLYEATRRTVRAVVGADAFAMPLMRRSSAAIRQELGKIRDCANQISMDMSRILENRQKERSDNAR